MRRGYRKSDSVKPAFSPEPSNQMSGKAKKIKLEKKSKENYSHTRLDKCSSSVPRRSHLNNLSLISVLLTEETLDLPADPLKTFLANFTQSALQQ